MTPDPREAAPLTPEEEARWRDYIGAAGRGVEFVKGGVFDMTARLLATLDAEREEHLEALAIAHMMGAASSAERAARGGDGLREAVLSLPAGDACFCEADRDVAHDEADGGSVVYVRRAAVLALLDPAP